MSESHLQSLDMSSDKNLVPKCISKNSHSFDDRVCDDLSEVLLQFLPLEGKLRLECVSKQFQRTVFQKQFSITLYSCLQSNNEMSKYFKGKSFKIYYSKSIESLLKKCPNIQFLSLFLKNNGIFESILPLITKCCRYLNEFNVTLKDRRTEPELNEEFLRLFGPKLKYISCGANLDLNSFPNLYSIEKKSFSLFNIVIPRFTSPERAVALNLMKLKELIIDIYPQNDVFPEVLQKFHKIRQLGLILYTINENSVINSFKGSSILQNLIELKYRGCGTAEKSNQFFDSLKQFAEKFPKLKNIEISPIWV